MEVPRGISSDEMAKYYVAGTGKGAEKASLPAVEGGAEEKVITDISELNTGSSDEDIENYIKNVATKAGVTAEQLNKYIDRKGVVRMWLERIQKGDETQESAQKALEKAFSNKAKEIKAKAEPKVLKFVENEEAGKKVQEVRERIRKLAA